MTQTLGSRVSGLIDYLLVDAESDRLLFILVLAILGQTDRLSLVCHGDDTMESWQAITDPAVAPLWALPYAAQWTGGTMPARLVGETDTAYLDRARLEVLHPRSMRRGGPTSLRIAAQAHLTGTKTVQVVQFFAGDEWQIGVLVKADEAPDHAALEAAVNDDQVINAGMKAVVVYGDVPLWAEASRTWQEMAAGVNASNVTIADIT